MSVGKLMPQKQQQETKPFNILERYSIGVHISYHTADKLAWISGKTNKSKLKLASDLLEAGINELYQAEIATEPSEF